MRKKDKIIQIKERFKNGGCKLLSKEYNGYNKELDYICPVGHKASITLRNWNRGRRCSVCAGNMKLDIEFIRESFIRYGYVLISKEYVNAFSKLNYICPAGHYGSITWNNWQQGKRCSTCAGKNINIKFVKFEFEKEGYICTSKEYINSTTYLTYICPNGHVGSTTWSNWQQGARCSKCSMNGISLWENTVKQFVKSLKIPFLENDRTNILNPNTNRYLELDLWFPNLSKAMECNSEYWHKDRKHIDVIKQKWCEDNNVFLLNINFEDWNNDIKKCQKEIQNFLN